MSPEGEQTHHVKAKFSKIRNSENGPGQGNKHQHMEVSHDKTGKLPSVPEEFLHNDEEKQAQTPDQEVGGQAMPDPGDDPDHQEIKERADLAASAASQGEIHVIPKEHSQGDVPSAVKVCYAAGTIGLVEVLDKGKAQHDAKTCSHQGIPPEIKVQFQRIAVGTQPGKGCGDGLKADGLKLVPEHGQMIRQKDLHGQTEDKIPQTVIHILQHFSAVLFFRYRIVPLSPEMVVGDKVKSRYRALKDLGKETKVQCRIPERGPCHHLSTVKICLIGDHLETIKTDANRQKRRIHVGSQYLKRRQRTDIQKQCQDQKKLSFPAA